MADATLVDLVKITALTTGTGSVTLGDAVPGYRGVEALLDGAVYGYSIQQEAEYEIGRCTYLQTSNQIVRSPTFTSNGGTPINLQANASIAFVATAEDILGRDVLRPLYGYGAPTNNVGVIGQVYTDLNVPVTLYGPKTTSGWGVGVVLQGDPGAPGSTATYQTLTALKAADPAALFYALVTDAGLVNYGLVSGDYTGKTDDVNVIALDAVPVSTAALVRQASTGITAKRAAIGAVIRSAQSNFDDAVTITQFGAVGGNKVKDTAGFNAAVAYAWTRGRAVCIPDSDTPFIFDKIILPTNEVGIDGDPARPTRFLICGTGAVRFDEAGFLFDAPTGHYFYDLVVAGGLRFFATAGGGGTKFINGDKFIRLTLAPGLNLRNIDYGLFGVRYLQTVRARGVTFRGGAGAFVKVPMAYDCSITDNIIEFGNDGIVIDGSGDPAVHTCRLDDNVIEGMGGRGIVTGACLATSVHKNYMESNAGGEIFLNAGTAVHKGLSVQLNSLQQIQARLNSGARAIVWGSSLALPAMSGGNFCTGNLHDLTGSAGLLSVIGDYVPTGKSLVNTGRTVTTDNFTYIFNWFDRSALINPYQQELVFTGKFNGATGVAMTWGLQSPAASPGSFERASWGAGSIVWNSNPVSGAPMGWRCTASGTPGTWAAMANTP